MMLNREPPIGTEHEATREGLLRNLLVRAPRMR
ncbi:MAG: hypothetical protein ACI89X_002446 [Planctomycetota bacterium]|jgi:hypothetical protein